MVATLIEATAQTIARHGLDGTTTALIAETAGVSVGSLYQYFDSKEALIEALLEKLARDMGQLLSRQFPVDAIPDLRSMVHGVIQLALAFMHGNEGLYLELVRNWHRLPVQHVADTLERQVLQIGHLYFLKHQREYPVQNLQVRLFICFNSVLFTMVRLFSQENVLLQQDEVVAGLTEMVTGYLEGTPGGGAPYPTVKPPC